MFKWVSYLCVAVFLYVGVVLLVMPATQIETLGLAVDPGAEVMGRRSAPLYFVVSMIGLYFAHQPVGQARTVFASAWGGSLLLVAVLGAVDLFMGRVSSDVLLAIVVEVAMAFGLLLSMRRGDSVSQ